MGEIISYDHEKHEDRIFQVLDTLGTGKGTTNVTGNYALSSQDFFIQTPAGEVYIIERMVVHIEDAGNFSAGGYGAGGVLTNGIKAHITESDNTIVKDMFDGFAVLHNAHWGAVCYDIDYVSFGAGNNSLNVRWTFSRAGLPIVLKEREKLKIVANDDFTGLVEHYYFVHGYRASLKKGVLSR